MEKTRPLLWTFLLCVVLTAQIAFGQTTLTQIRDTIVNADGSLFNGTVVITWNGFAGPSGGTSPLSTSARIYNGALSVLLVPTTTASAGTFYQAVYYSSDGTTSWTETWQVSPSNTPLVLSTIRTSTSQGGGSSTGTGGSSGSGGSSGGTNNGNGQYATLPISISQVTSLSADLANINSLIAALTAQLNNASSSGFAAGTSSSFVDAETPAGTLDGVNKTFTLAHVPAPVSSLAVFRNGLLQSPGVDYALSGSVITFLPASIPLPTDLIDAQYRLATPGPNAIFVDAELPGGTIDGNNTTFTLASAPNPPLSLKLYKNGVLLTQNTDYTLSGNTITAGTNSIPQSGDALLAAYRH